MVQRQRRHPFLVLFDGADPDASTANRQTTTVPTQALYFINDPFFHAQAELLASNLLEDASDDARVTQVYRRLFQREPSNTEIARCQKLLANYPGGAEDQWSALARVLLASNEFIHVD
jgi:dienelactone hydrolase